MQGVASQVETTTSEVSAQWAKQMRELPLNGRDFEQLILLAPGVQQVTSGRQNSFYGRAQAYSIAGSRPEGQELLLDGADIQTFWGHGAGNSIIGTSLGVDAIGEFQVLTNLYSARFGGSGSVMNQTTRSGTNNIHGSGFEFIRNSAVDAKNYFDSATRPSLHSGETSLAARWGGPSRRTRLSSSPITKVSARCSGRPRWSTFPTTMPAYGIIGSQNFNPRNSGIVLHWPFIPPLPQRRKRSSTAWTRT